jgi:D-alanine-D-alanine ligase
VARRRRSPAAPLRGPGRTLPRAGAALRIALVYDLREEYLAAGLGDEETAEFDRADTIDAIEQALRELGHETERVGHLRALMRRLLEGSRWDLVFNTAEGVRGFGRESEAPALLEAFGIPYTFSDPLVCALTLHKGMAKRVLRDLGIPTTDFAVVEAERDLARVDLPFPLFVKPIAEGTAKGIDGSSRVSSPEELELRCRHVISTFRQPALVEPFLPGREFTVGILGTGAAAEAVGTLEVMLAEGAEPHSYTYRNKERCEELCRYDLAPPADAERCEGLALAAWRGLGARDGGRVDLREDAQGHLMVLELNPLPGLHPTHSDLPMIWSGLGRPYRGLLERIVNSAAARRGAPAPAPRRAAVAAGLGPGGLPLLCGGGLADEAEEVGVRARIP